MQEAIDRLRTEGLARIEQAGATADLETVRVALLGRKGEVTALLRGLKDADPAQRPALGASLNRLKQDLGEALALSLSASLLVKANEYDRARVLLDQARAIEGETGNRRGTHSKWQM